MLDRNAMTHREKVDYMMTDLAKRGIKRGTMSPPLYRLLWWMGIPATPPHFAHYLSNAVFMATWFALAYGLLMWFWMWRDQGYSAERAISVSVCAGVFFGVTLSAYYTWQARKHSLPKWKDYPKLTERTI